MEKAAIEGSTASESGDPASETYDISGCLFSIPCDAVSLSLHRGL